MVVVDFEPISKRVAVVTGSTLLDAVNTLGHAISSVCGGAGTCGKCRLVVVEGASSLGDPTAAEEKRLGDQLLEAGYRLACQAKLLGPGPVRVLIPPESLEKRGRVLVEGAHVEVPPAPLSKKVFVRPGPPDYADVRSDAERLLDALAGKVSGGVRLSHQALKLLPGALRAEGAGGGVTLTLFPDTPPTAPWTVTVVEPGDQTGRHYGVAVDVGTTTVVAYLLDLSAGKVVATSSDLNPQVAYGEDVITRMTRATDPATREKLTGVIRQCVVHLCEDACIQAGVSPRQVVEVHLVGNTAMHHLFLGLSTDALGLAPFPPVVRSAVDASGLELGLAGFEHARVRVLPVIAGFVGADTVGVILAGSLDQLEPFTLTIDIGTNGELVLGNAERGLVAGSCAAGSALEGAHLTAGMRAAGGAVEKVEVDPRTLEVSYRTINDEPAVGICGSGILDAVAELVRAKVVTRSGAFTHDPEVWDNPRLLHVPVGGVQSAGELGSSSIQARAEEGGQGTEPAFVLVEAGETASGKPVLVTQGDVREFQKAKAAFYAGAKLLLLEATAAGDLGEGASNERPAVGRAPWDLLEQVLLAGAFGSYLDPVKLHFVGMIPDVDVGRVVQVGNAAGVGAQYSLLNVELRAKAEEVARKSRYVELTGSKMFPKEFAWAMYFPHFNYKTEFPSLAPTYDSLPKR
ncbi:MAG: ASKHA domain-containing protein [Promethearchaeota archaeon]